MIRASLALGMMIALASNACGNEISGFRLGTSMDKVRLLAIEKGYTFSNVMKSGDNERWASYLLMKEGPSISFCDATLSAVSLQRASSFHEIANLLASWRNALGEPDSIVVNPTYVQGVQFSTVEFKWVGQDNIRRNITMSQFGPQQINIGFGYSYIKHACQ